MNDEFSPNFSHLEGFDDTSISQENLAALAIFNTQEIFVPQTPSSGINTSADKILNKVHGLFQAFPSEMLQQKQSKYKKIIFIYTFVFSSSIFIVKLLRNKECF
jgi:hypothetical protein